MYNNVYVGGSNKSLSTMSRRKRNIFHYSRRQDFVVGTTIALSVYSFCNESKKASEWANFWEADSTDEQFEKTLFKLIFSSAHSNNDRGGCRSPRTFQRIWWYQSWKPKSARSKEEHGNATPVVCAFLISSCWMAEMSRRPPDAVAVFHGSRAAKTDWQH